MLHVPLAILGGILFLVTSLFDYYWTRIQSQESASTSTPKSPSDVPVGSKPSGYRSDSVLSKIEPRYLGYISAVILQLPLVASQLGWL